VGSRLTETIYEFSLGIARAWGKSLRMSFDRLWQDVRYGLWMMRRNPGFTAVAALSLALGIGANTAIFSLMDTVLLRTLPVDDPERLVQIQAAFRNEAFKRNQVTQSFSRRTFEYFRDHNQVFADTFAFDRTSEIGIRMALGAERRDVLRLVLRETMTLVMTGIAIGVPAALAMGRLAGHLVSGLLFGLTATDPVTIAIAVLLLAGGAVVAGYLPARRASRVDPKLALSYE